MTLELAVILLTIVTTVIVYMLIRVSRRNQE
jgi:hypothetical protein